MAERNRGVTEGFHKIGTARKVMLWICWCPCQFRGGVTNKDKVIPPEAPLVVVFLERLYNVDIGKAVTVDVENGKRDRQVRERRGSRRGAQVPLRQWSVEIEVRELSYALVETQLVLVTNVSEHIRAAIPVDVLVRVVRGLGLGLGFGMGI